MKNSSDTIGNETRDLPGCSTVRQPTAPPRALSRRSTILNIIKYPSEICMSGGTFKI
jgi:hypothetical protein